MHNKSFSLQEHSSDLQVRRIGVFVEFFFVHVHVMDQTHGVSAPSRGCCHNSRQPIGHPGLFHQVMLHFPQSILFLAPLLPPLRPAIFKPYLHKRIKYAALMLDVIPKLYGPIIYSTSIDSNARHTENVLIRHIIGNTIALNTVALFIHISLERAILYD